MILSVIIIAPDRTFWQTEAEEAILPTTTGQIGILTGHAPLLASLDIGVLRVKSNGKWFPLVVIEGFAEVSDNKLTVVVNAAEQGSSINFDEAKSDLEKIPQISDESKSPKEKLSAIKLVKKIRARALAAELSLAIK
uniref:ATP synthase epsilon chain, chloroplastic n=2 Tax=Pavlovaceae TaxID=418969 RepID=M1JFJ9_DIALT|nr:ATP synthase CF1 subunit epsilon [Diacronema lutheri]YP_009863847.1 ATP synthase CF1 epsilon subunit [Pavlova sp. NIVA-4/92]AGE93823.1 ATP synthase CF1 subunit epsilon [Diacronema lutheri]QKE31178.1 ATP synthase CF1 epsilon subunit [Pavlova sp. NIVA-4/92]|mmetsp:Transcript_16090/g.50152  ORF Transcript_16090/g.50152 Transcript_16090/m.50152 type:complete len:137 (-) Transcript_16090:792-1202(-)|eukprot:scaffold975_cov394-Pavlova_lutheri.AAC.30